MLYKKMRYLYFFLINSLCYFVGAVDSSRFLRVGTFVGTTNTFLAVILSNCKGESMTATYLNSQVRVILTREKICKIFEWDMSLSLPSPQEALNASFSSKWTSVKEWMRQWGEYGGGSGGRKRGTVNAQHHQIYINCIGKSPLGAHARRGLYFSYTEKYPKAIVTFFVTAWVGPERSEGPKYKRNEVTG